MARITDYASLSAAVVDHTTREDLADSMDRFVQMAEQAMKRRLRTLDMEKTVSQTISSGTFELPEDLLTLLTLTIGDDDVTEAAGAYRRSGTTVTLDPEPSEETTVTYTYIAAFTPLEEGATNWLIEQHPDVYFYGTLAHAFAHYRDTEAQVVAESQFRNALEEIATSRNRDRWGPGIIAPVPITQVYRAKC